MTSDTRHSQEQAIKTTCHRSLPKHVHKTKPRFSLRRSKETNPMNALNHSSEQILQSTFIQFPAQTLDPTKLIPPLLFHTLGRGGGHVITKTYNHVFILSGQI